jgi:hypothetical protein
MRFFYGSFMRVIFYMRQKAKDPHHVTDERDIASLLESCYTASIPV